VLSRELDGAGLELSLFPVIFAFCALRDIATDERRVEALALTHAKTAEFFRASAVA
jgi:hypothetical protein